MHKLRVRRLIRFGLACYLGGLARPSLVVAFKPAAGLNIANRQSGLKTGSRVLDRGVIRGGLARRFKDGRSKLSAGSYSMVFDQFNPRGRSKVRNNGLAVETP